MVSLVLGTGVGGGIIIDNNLIKGNKNYAGEFGAMLLIGPKKVTDISSNYSTKSIIKKVEKKLNIKLIGEELFNLYNDKNKYAIEIMDE